MSMVKADSPYEELGTLRKYNKKQCFHAENAIPWPPGMAATENIQSSERRQRMKSPAVRV